MTADAVASVDLQRASALCSIGRFAEAADVVRRSLSTQPHDPVAWSMLAAAELGSGSPEPALKAARNAIGLDPEAEWPHRLASAALRRLGRTGESVEHAREAVRLEPDGWPGLSTLARSMARDGADLNEARTVAARAIAMAPDDPEPHITAGVVAAAAGDRSAAEAAFQRALAIDPQSGAAHNEMARMRMSGRAHANPAGLADAASGFANTVRLNPAGQTGRRNLEVVLRVFLAKTSYFVFVDAYVITRLASSSSDGMRRLLPILLLAVPLAYAARFVGALDGSLRSHLARMLLRERTIAFAVALDLVAVACIFAASLAPPSASNAFAAAAALTALISRLVLWSQVEHSSRAATGRAARHALSSLTLYLIAAGLLLAAAVFVVAHAEHGGNGAIVAAIVCGGLGACVAINARRRSAGAARLTRAPSNRI